MKLKKKKEEKEEVEISNECIYNYLFLFFSCKF